MRPCSNPSICGVRNHRPGTVCRAQQAGRRRGPREALANVPPISAAPASPSFDDILESSRPPVKRVSTPFTSDQDDEIRRRIVDEIAPPEALGQYNEVTWDDRGVEQTATWGTPPGTVMYGDSLLSREPRTDGTIRTLWGQVDTPEDVVRVMADLSRRHESMTDSDWRGDEDLTIRNYSMYSSLEMNETLRDGRPDLIHPEVLDTMDRATSSDKLQEDTVVYRGVQWASPKSDHMESFSDPAYLSVTDNPHVAREFAQNGYVLMFTLPRGSRVKDLRSGGYGSQGEEREMILPRNMKIRDITVFDMTD